MTDPDPDLEFTERSSLAKAQELSNAALIAAQKGDFNEARNMASLAAILAPGMEDPWLVLAVVSQPSDSLRFLQRALLANPKSQRARKGIAWAEQRLKESEASLGATQRLDRAAIPPEPLELIVQATPEEVVEIIDNPTAAAVAINTYGKALPSAIEIPPGILVYHLPQHVQQTNAEQKLRGFSLMGFLTLSLLLLIFAGALGLSYTSGLSSAADLHLNLAQIGSAATPTPTLIIPLVASLESPLASPTPFEINTSAPPTPTAFILENIKLEPTVSIPSEPVIIPNPVGNPDPYIPPESGNQLNFLPLIANQQSSTSAEPSPGSDAPDTIPLIDIPSPMPTLAPGEPSVAVPTSEAPLLPVSPTPGYPIATVGPVPTSTPGGAPLPTWVPPVEPPGEVQPPFDPQPPRLFGPGQRPENVGTGEEWIDVNVSTQMVYAMIGDNIANQFIVSTGRWPTPTINGVYRIYIKYRTANMRGDDYYLANVPYVMYFYKGYGLHGTYWHSNFGTPMSHGCVNLRPEDAGWLFDFARVGTVVSVH